MTAFRVLQNVAIGLALIGCGWEDPSRFTGLAPADATLGSVSISPRNAILAVGGTLTMELSGQAMTGEAVTAFDSVVFVLSSISDTARLGVDQDGTITGKASSGTFPIELRAFAFKDGVGKGDRAVIQVTPAAVPGVSLSIQPAGTDSTKLALGLTKNIRPVIRNAGTGQSVPSPQLRLVARATPAKAFSGGTPFLALPGIGGVSESEPLVFGRLNVIGAILGEGQSWIYAEVNAYGTLLRDSVLYTASYPYTATMALITQDRSFQIGLNEATAFNNKLAPGATLTIQNGLVAASGLPISVTFDDPAGATAAVPASTIGGASGNVASLTPGQTSRRRFLTQGTYRYTATVGGNIAPFSGQTVRGEFVVK